MNSKVKRDVYGTEIAYKLKIPYDNLLKEIEKWSARNQKKEMADMVSSELRKLDGYGDRVNPDRVKYPDIVKIEESVLGILLKYPEFYRETKDLFEDLFVSEFNKKIYGLFKSAAETLGENLSNFDTVMITQGLPDEETFRIAAMTAQIEGKAIQKDSLEKAIDALREKKKKLESKISAQTDVSNLSFEEMAEIMKQKGMKQKDKDKKDKKGDN